MTKVILFTVALLLTFPIGAALSWVLTPTLREMEVQMAGPPDLEEDRWMIYPPKR